MGKLVIACALLAGCVGSEQGTIRIDCFDGRPCDSGALGMGGVLFYDLYDSDGLADGATLVSADDAVAAIRHDEPSVKSIVGVAPGTTKVIMLDAHGNEAAELPVVVQPVTEIRFDIGAQLVDGPFLDPTHDAAYRVPAGPQGFAFKLNPFVGPSRSIGTHYFTATLDGSPYNDCYQLECNGPIFYDVIGFWLDAGDHTLVLHPTDGGREFTYTLHAQ